MKKAGLLIAPAALLVACGSGSTVATVTRTFVLTEPANPSLQLEVVVTAVPEDAGQFRSALVTTEPAGTALTTKNGDQHTLPRVCASSFHTPDGTFHFTVFGSAVFPVSICQELVKLGSSTPSAT